MNLPFTHDPKKDLRADDLQFADHPQSKYRVAKEVYLHRKTNRQTVKDIALIILGILSAGFGLQSFLLPSHFIDGGATGISLLLSKLTSYPLYVLIVAVNIPFILLGFRQIGGLFAIKTICAIIGLALVLAFVKYPTVTEDKLLVAVFGGFFLGAGIGLAVRGGCVLDGSEVLAIYLSRKSGSTIGDIILLINIVIFSAAAYFLGLETAMYSMLTYMSASKTVDFLIEGLEEYTGVTIISPKNEEIAKMITTKLGRGVTVYNGSGGYGKRGFNRAEQKILFTVITRLEISRIKAEIALIDSYAFVVMHSIKDTKGGMIKKRPMMQP
jgi:uncharacterized membrane-anchored protein YitT (DUF2179 family)